MIQTASDLALTDFRSASILHFLLVMWVASREWRSKAPPSTWLICNPSTSSQPVPECSRMAICSNILVRLQHEKHRKGAYIFIKLSWETSAEVKTMPLTTMMLMP